MPRGDLSLDELLNAPLTYEEKAVKCLERIGLRDQDDVNLRHAAIVFAILEVANELYRANPE